MRATRRGTRIGEVMKGNMMKGKKGDALPMLNWGTMRMLFITAFLVFTYLLATSHLSTTADTSQLRSRILTERVLLSLAEPSPLSGRAVPGMTERELLNDTALDTRITVSGDFMSASVTLIGEGEHTAFLNKKWYDRNEPLATFDGYSLNVHTSFVLSDASPSRLVVRTVQHD